MLIKKKRKKKIDAHVVQKYCAKHCSALCRGNKLFDQSVLIKKSVHISREINRLKRNLLRSLFGLFKARVETIKSYYRENRFTFALEPGIDIL